MSSVMTCHDIVTHKVGEVCRSRSCLGIEQVRSPVLRSATRKLKLAGIGSESPCWRAPASSCLAKSVQLRDLGYDHASTTRITTSIPLLVRHLQRLLETPKSHSQTERFQPSSSSGGALLPFSTGSCSFWLGPCFLSEARAIMRPFWTGDFTGMWTAMH